MGSDKRFVDQFGMTAASLERRREFLRLTDEDLALLVKLIPWAKEIAPQLAKDFYDSDHEIEKHTGAAG